MRRTLVKEGWLEKQGGFIKNWKNRWFVLTSDMIIYYRVPNREEMGRFELNPECSVSIENDLKNGPCFSVSTSKRKYLIVANSNETRDEWINAIENVINKLKENNINKDIIEEEDNGGEEDYSYPN